MTTREQRIHSVVTALVAAVQSVDTAALTARLDACQRLENLGFSEWEVIEARAQALDGFSVEEIVQGLVGEVAVG